MEKLRFYTNNAGPIIKNEAKSLQKAFQLAEKIDGIDEVIILIHTKSNTGYLERTLGIDKIKGLFSGKFKAFDGGPRVIVETKKTISDSNKKRVLLSFGLSSNDLFKYDGFHSVMAIVGHQWSQNDLKDWSEAWGAEEIISGVKLPKIDNVDIVVKNAFDALSKSINKDTGIRHPMDEELCKTYLRALNKYGYNLNEKDIKSYLITEKGWESDYVDDVISLVSKLNSGSYFRGGRKTRLNEYIENWKN